MENPVMTAKFVSQSCVHAAVVSLVAFCAEFMSTHSPLAVQFEVLVP